MHSGCASRRSCCFCSFLFCLCFARVRFPLPLARAAAPAAGAAPSGPAASPSPPAVEEAPLAALPLRRSLPPRLPWLPAPSKMPVPSSSSSSSSEDEEDEDEEPSNAICLANVDAFCSIMSMARLRAAFFRSSIAALVSNVGEAPTTLPPPPPPVAAPPRAGVEGMVTVAAAEDGGGFGAIISRHRSLISLNRVSSHFTPHEMSLSFWSHGAAWTVHV